MRNLLSLLLLLGSASALPSSVVSVETSAKSKLKRVKLKRQADEQTKALMVTLSEYIMGDELHPMEERKPSNGIAFLHLAASAKQPKVVALALRSMARTWRSSPSKRSVRPVMDEDYHAVVMARVNSKNPQIRSGALSAGRMLLIGNRPNPEFLKQILKMATQAPIPDQIAAIAMLYNVRDYQIPKPRPGNRKSKIIAELLSNLEGDETLSIMATLRSLNRISFVGMPQSKRLSKVCVKLLEHKEPRVQGGAALLLSSIAQGQKKVLIPRFQEMLQSEYSFLRAIAITGLASFGDLSSAHAMVKLTGDSGKSESLLGGFKDLNGKPGRIKLRVPGGVQINGVALFGLQLLTRDWKAPFSYESFGSRDRQEGRKKGIKAAKSWYKANKAKLPKAPKLKKKVPKKEKKASKPKGPIKERKPAKKGKK